MTDQATKLFSTWSFRLLLVDIFTNLITIYLALNFKDFEQHQTQFSNGYGFLLNLHVVLLVAGVLCVGMSLIARESWKVRTWIVAIVWVVLLMLQVIPHYFYYS